MKTFHICLLAGLLASLLGSSAALATPSIVNYQGFVTDSNGDPIGTATTPVNRKIAFKVYSTATGGGILWAEEHTATLAAGRFSVLLGNGAAFSNEPHANLNDLFKSGSDYYVGITVDDGDGTFNQTDTEISPRQRIVSSVFALRAATADSVASGGDLSLGIDNGLGFYDSSRQFNGLAVNGPVLYGAGGGVLGAQSGATQTTALRWDGSGNVNVSNDLTVSNKLSVSSTGELRLNDGPLFLRDGPDQNHGLKHYTTLDETNFDGPVLFGYQGGALAFTNNGIDENGIAKTEPTLALHWLRKDEDSVTVSINGDLVTTGSGSFNTLSTTGIGTFGNLTSTGLATLSGGVTINGSTSSAGQISTTSNLRATNGLYLGSDQFHGIQRKATFDSTAVDGPVVYGYGGGALGTVQGPVQGTGPIIEKIALTWDAAGNVKVGDKHVTTGEESLKIIRGVINSDGSILTGEGFIVDRDVGGGRYLVQFTPGFSDIPAVTASPYRSGSADYALVAPAGVAMLDEELKSSIILEIRSGGHLTDWGVSFIAVGKR